MKNSNRLWRFLYKFHRYIGLSSAIVLLMLAITGIALNHTEKLRLDSRMIQSKTILDWYGIKEPKNLNSFSTQKHWVTQSGQQIYLDHSPLIKTADRLVGAIETDAYIVTAFSQSLLLLSLQGEVIERISIDALERIGLNPQQQVIIMSNQHIKYSDDELLSWQPYSNKNVTWSSSSPLPSVISNTIKKASRSTILPLERVILDLHSGRLFGHVGVFIVDLTGICLIILVLSGCAIWLKHKLRSLRHSYHRYRKQQ